MLLFILFLIPVLITGIIFLHRLSSLSRLELLIPTGSVLGFAVFTFLLNFVAFFLKGSVGIIVSYMVMLGLGFVVFKSFKAESTKLDFPAGKQLIFWILSVLAWGGFIFWKSAYALIGSDTNLYYTIAHSFIKGNFPFLTPWQPDIPLSYHVGTSELLGAFYYFSGLNFQFLHLILAAIFIFFTVQSTLWIIKRHLSLTSFILANLAMAVVFISFGFIYITWPILPARLPEFDNFNQLVLWLRNLPNVSSAIEVYGAPVNLDAFIYFIFHAFGFAIFISLVVLLLNPCKEKPVKTWGLICINLAALAFINESLFVVASPAVAGGIILILHKEKKLLKNLRILSGLLMLTVFIVLFQGGIISTFINSSSLQESAIILPAEEEIKEDFKSYHLGQISSKLLPGKKEWLPLSWFHPGVYLLLISSFAVTLINYKEFRYSILLKVLFIAGTSSLVAYQIIVPKFLVANGNRFLVFSFMSFSLLLCLSVIPFFEKIKQSKVSKILFLILVGWILVPSILPSLSLLSKTRFGENKLIPRYQQSSRGILWLKDNVSFDKRVMVLDRNAPHPSGQARALVEAGVFAPVFSGEVRAYTIEASPEYIDSAYYLSPKALKKLRVDTLLIDSIFFVTLPEQRKRQLEDSAFFEKVFDDSEQNQSWEKIYQIKDEYLQKGGELDGTFEQLLKIIPAKGKIYIDREENFNPSFLRRPLIFSLRKREIYYLPQSGVYLNVEADINSHPPLDSGNYDYLILGKNNLPARICKCQTSLIWKGINGEVFVWKKID